VGELIGTQIEGLALIVLSDDERKSGRAETLNPWLGEADWTHFIVWGGQCVGAMMVTCGVIGSAIVSPPALEVTGVVFKVRDGRGVELFATYPRRYRYPAHARDDRTEGFHQTADELTLEALEAAARFLGDAGG